MSTSRRECFTLLRATVRTILERPFAMPDWSVQGFGMLRCYLDPDKKYRLNIWDRGLMVPNVSTIHDHPWHFTSWIINGAFRNTRFNISPDPLYGNAFDWQVIRTGPGGGPEDGEHGTVRLIARAPEQYRTGDRYHQEAKEIHSSAFMDGTVTLNDRVRLSDSDHARVFWLTGQHWVNAQPRVADQAEILHTTQKALTLWQ